jgi:hypothetical protein
MNQNKMTDPTPSKLVRELLDKKALQAKKAAAFSSSTQTHKRTGQTSRRDQMLNKLPYSQQIEIRNWAEERQIKSDEALWLLVDLMGYTKFMTNTLPSQMRAAGQEAVDAIAQQRKAEADAFSVNVRNSLNAMLTEMTAQVAESSDRMTDAKLKHKIWQYSLLAVSGVSLLGSICFIFGYLFAKTQLPWLLHSSENIAIKMLQVIFQLPVGYIIIPTTLFAIILFWGNWIRCWHETRQWYRR